MSDSDRELERRLAAVERALDEDTGSDRPSEADATDDLESRVTALESRVDELDAAVQAVRGFLGGVSAVNEAVERRADAAVAAVERLERRLDGERGTDGGAGVAEDDDTPTISFDGGNDGTTDGEQTDRSDEPDESTLRERLRGLR